MSKSNYTLVGQFNAVASGAVRYFALNSIAGQTNSGHDTNDPSDPSGESTSKAYAFRNSGKVKSMKVRLTYPASGAGAKIILRNNGIDMLMQASVSDGFNTASSETDVAINADDLFAMKVDNQSADAIEGFWSLEIEED